MAGVSERLLRIADESGYAGWVREASGEKNIQIFMGLRLLPPASALTSGSGVRGMTDPI